MDGRHARREQNRAAVVAALVELYGEGRYEPSAAEIAQRAGLSPRSLFRYFDDTDDLARAAIADHQARARPLLRVDAAADDPLDDRIAAVVESRLALWQAVAPGARVARMRAPLSTVVAAELRQVRAYLRRQLGHLFDAPPAALAAADVLCSFESIELLLHDQRLSRAKAAAVLTRSLRALLAPGGPPP